MQSTKQSHCDKEACRQEITNIRTSAGSPPTKILFAISVPYLGILPDETGVPEGVSDKELSLDD